MSKLSQEAQSIVEAAKIALRPTPADRERIREALVSQIGNGGGVLRNGGSTPLSVDGVRSV